MTIYIKRLPIGSFLDGYVCPPDSPVSFRLYALIEENKNTTFNDIKSLDSNDKLQARNSVIKLHKHAVQGQPFREVFDGRQYHLGHQFNYLGETLKIWRLWLAGDIRIYILHLQDRIVLIIKTLAKREDQLSNSEITELESITKKVINCTKHKLVNLLDEKNVKVENY